MLSPPRLWLCATPPARDSTVWAAASTDSGELASLPTQVCGAEGAWLPALPLEDAQPLHVLLYVVRAGTCVAFAWLRLHDALAQPGQATAIDAPAQRWLAALAAQLDAPDPDRALRAASAWLQWERALMEPDTPACAGPEAGALAAARIGVHYARNAFFLQERALLRNAQRMAHIPGAIVHGEADRVTPVAAAIELHGAWPGSSLQRIAQAGHASSHPEMARALIAAVDTLGAGPI